MLVLKKKYDKLVEDYNRLVDTKNYWEEAYTESKSKVVRLEQQCNKCYKELDKQADKIVNVEFERDTYRVELERTDKVVLQYEKRINELEEE